MPFRKLQLKAGVNLLATPTLNQAQFAVTNLCRFYGGLIQKMGGWLRLSLVPATFSGGFCRALHSWADILGNNYLAVGTEQLMQIVIGHDIDTLSPLVQTSTSVPFDTQAGLAQVIVTDATYAPPVGSWIFLPVTFAVGGLILGGLYQVTSFTGIDSFTFNAASPAISNGATTNEVEYLIVLTSVPEPKWSVDNFGQDLIAALTEGALYYWQPPTLAPMTVVPNSPLFNGFIFVMSQVQIIVSINVEVSGTREPLLVRWCDAGDFTDWVATATNQAGSFQIPSGSTLVTGLAVGLGALLWTDIDLWSMVYEGLPFVFGFNRIAAQCGAISQNCVGIVGTLVMWLSKQQGFFTYSLGGSVSPMECPVWDFFYNNYDPNSLALLFCAPIPELHEFIWFFYISTSSPIYSGSAPIGYVKFNFIENVWDYGQSAQFQRTAWAPHVPPGNPLGADTAFLLQQQETGFDADGAGMQWEWQTGYFDLAEGEQYPFVDLIIPDNVTSGSPTINYSVFGQNYPNGSVTTYGPYPVTPATQFVPLRARNRQIAIGASGSDLGTFNRLGELRYRVAPDGRA